MEKLEVDALIITRYDCGECHIEKSFLLAKIFENKEYMQDFLNGKIYMNSIAYFKVRENNNNTARHDSNESLSCYLQPKFISLELNGHEFNMNNFRDAIKIYHYSNNSKNIFCMWSVSTDNDILRGEIHIDEQNKEFGEHLVVITSAKAFLERIKSAIENIKLNSQMGLVNYYDRSTHKIFEEAEIAFNKLSNFSYQQEYRIAIDINTNNEPYILDIGDLKDISMVPTIDEFNQNISIVQNI